MSIDDGLIDAKVALTLHNHHVLVSTRFLTADEFGVTERCIGEVALTPRGAIRAAFVLVKYAYRALRDKDVHDEEIDG